MTEQYQGIGSARFGAPSPREALAASPWSSSAQSILAPLFSAPNLSRPFIRELQSLRAETDPELFFESLLHLGRRHRQERPELALACFARVRESLNREFAERPASHRALLERAQSEIDAIEGRGSIGSRVEYLSGNFIREASNPVSLASMAAGGLVFSTVRTGMLARLLGNSAAYWSRGFGARAVASSIAFGAELPAFVLSGRLLHQAAGQSQDWSPRSLGQEFAQAGITLGLLKIGGAAAGAATQRWAQGSGFLPVASRAVLPQAAMLGGILIAHRVEQDLGLRPQVDGGTAFTDAFTTLLQFYVSGRLLETAMGPRYAALQRSLHLRSEALAATPRSSGSTWFGPPRASEQLALASLSPRRARRDPRSSHIAMMSNEGDGKPPTPPPAGTPRPSRETEGGTHRPTNIHPTGGGLAAKIARENRGKVPPIVAGTRLGPGPEGRFEVIRELGQGGVGKVFLVKDTREVAGTRSERLSVIKVPMKGITDPQTLRRIVREIRIGEKLSSTWAAPIYDHFEWPPGSGVYIPVMEFIDGHVFSDILYARFRGDLTTDRAYSLARRIDLFAELCLGVHDAHIHDVVHRDLKPDNLRVDRNGRMRILDWGAAQAFTQAATHEFGGEPSAPAGNGHSELHGTLGYIPPEVVGPNKSNNPRVRDIFALGVILYETATGLHPFGDFRPGDPRVGEPSLVPEWEVIGSTRYHRITQIAPGLGPDALDPPPFRRIMTGEFPPYLAEIEQIARRAMHQDPTQRFQSATELREAVLMARARADREALNELQRSRSSAERQMTESWDWKIFNVVSKANPTLWAEGERTIHRLREMRNDWREGVNDLVIRLYEATKYEHIPEAHEMIAEISWEKWEEGGDRMARGERERLEQRIRENDFELSSGRRFSEVLTGRAQVQLQFRSPDPELDANPRIRVVPWEREVDESGQETGKFRPGETVLEGLFSDIRESLQLPVGYYAFEIYEPGFARINVPVQITRRSVREAVEDNAPFLANVDLIPAQTVPKHMVLVQGGASYTGLDFYHDGMPSNVYSFPMRSIELPTFAISRDMVTVHEYTQFISDLLRRGEIAPALEFMPRKREVQLRGAPTPSEITRIFKEEEIATSRNFYWRVVPTYDNNGLVYRLIDPTTHLDPNGDPIYADQPVSAISPEAAEAYVRWRSQRDGFPYRLASANEKEKVDRNSFPWTYPWGYESSPFAGIFRMTFQGDRNLTAFPQPIGRHPMGQEYYRDFTIYGTRDNLGNVRELTSSEGESGTVVLSGGSVRVPYGPFFMPAGRNYPLLRKQVQDSIGGIRLAMDIAQASDQP